MAIHVLEREQWIARPIHDVFAYFADAGNLEAITPPWLRFRIISAPTGQMETGSRIAYRLRWRFVPIRWLTEIVEWAPPFHFVDVQARGPYALWEHTHVFQPDGEGTRMCDTVRYALPLGIIGTALHRLVVRQDIRAIFDYRARQVGAIFQA